MERADLIIANSHNTQRRLRDFLGLDSEVIYPPVRTNSLRYIASSDYYLSTARLDPLKRVDRIVDAFLQMPDKRLVIVSGGSEEVRLRRLAGHVPNIKFAGWVSDARLRELLGRCIATLYVPINEDLGISPIESMAAGKPVIGVREGGLCETIVHEETGWLLDPRLETGDLVACVRACTVARAREMRDACEYRASFFTDEIFGQRLMTALDRLAVERRIAEY